MFLRHLCGGVDESLGGQENHQALDDTYPQRPSGHGPNFSHPDETGRSADPKR